MSAAAETIPVQDHVATVTDLATRHAVAPVEVKVRAAPAVDWRGLVTPPDLWSDDRPALRKVWLYGVYGRWAAADGAWRFAGAAYATVIALPIHTALYGLLWLVERPARLLVAFTIAALIHFAF